MAQQGCETFTSAERDVHVCTVILSVLPALRVRRFAGAGNEKDLPEFSLDHQMMERRGQLDFQSREPSGGSVSSGRSRWPCVHTSNAQLITAFSSG